MLSICNTLAICILAVLLCHNVWQVASITGGKEVDSTIIRTLGGENAMDIWVPQFVFNHKTVCTGVTLTAEADLTSATCFSDNEPVEALVMVTSHGADSPPVQVVKIDRCVKFNRRTEQIHDLMVCFHHCQWNFSDNVFVPRLNLQWDWLLSDYDEKCSLVGFGHLSADGDKCNVLHVMDIHLGASQECGFKESDMLNHICGKATEQQACAGDGGEPLLCQYNSSEYFVCGITKQADCSARQQYNKFLFLGYYRDWLERTVPGLVSASETQNITSSHGKPGMNGDVADPDLNYQKTNDVQDGSPPQPEKCPIIAHPPSAHVHKLFPTENNHSVVSSQTASANDDDTSLNSTTINSPHLSDRDVSNITVSETSDSAEASEHPVKRIDMPLSIQQNSSNVSHLVSVRQASHNPDLFESSAEGDRSAANITLPTTAAPPISKLPDAILSASYGADDTYAGNGKSLEESFPIFTLSEESNSGNGGLINTIFLNTSSVINEISPNTVPPQLSSSDYRLSTEVPLSEVLPNTTGDSFNLTILFASLADDWDLPNATHTVAQPSGSNEPSNLKQHNNEALLNFTYVMDSSLPSKPLSSPGHRNRTSGTVHKKHSSSNDELPKATTELPNSTLSNLVPFIGHKSVEDMGKSSQVSANTSRTNTSRTQDALPFNSKPVALETDHDKLKATPENLTHTDRPQNSANSSAPPPGHLSGKTPSTFTNNPTAFPGTLVIEPSYWEWLKRNAIRIPKNPLQNPKIFGTNLMYRSFKNKYESASRERFAQKYRLQHMWPDSENQGASSQYRQIWSRQVMSYPLGHVPVYNLENHIKSMQAVPSHPHSNKTPKNDVSGTKVFSKNFWSTDSVPSVTPSGYHNKSKDDISHMLSHPYNQWLKNNLPQRSETNKQRALETEEMPPSDETNHPPANARNRRLIKNVQTVLSRVGQHPHSRPGSSSPNAEMAKNKPSPSPSGKHSQPEGTFTGVLVSSVRNRQKRSSEGNLQQDVQEPYNADRNTLLADLADWPIHVGLISSQLTPPVSFLRAVQPNEETVTFPRQRYWFWSVFMSFLPSGNVARRLDMLQKTAYIWGRPITYDAFGPLKILEPIINGTPPLLPKQQPTDECNLVVRPGRSIHRKARHVEGNSQPASDAEIKLGEDVNDIVTPIQVKNESHVEGSNNRSHSGSPHNANISNQSTDGISVETVDNEKESTATNEERYPTTFSNTGKDATKSPALYDDGQQGQPEFYEDIKQVGSDDGRSAAQGTVSSLGTRNFKDDFQPASDEDIKLGKDSNVIVTPAQVKNEIYIEGSSNRSHSVSPDNANISNKSVGGISAETVDTEKANTVPNEERYSTAFEKTGKSATPTQIKNERHIEGSNNRSHSGSAANANISDESHGGISVETVGTEKGSTAPNEERYSTTFSNAVKDATKPPTLYDDGYQGQPEFYEDIKRLGTDDGRNAAQGTVSSLGVTLTFILTLVCLPSI